MQSSIGFLGLQVGELTPDSLLEEDLEECEVDYCKNSIHNICKNRKHQVCRKHLKNCPLCDKELSPIGENPDDDPPKFPSLDDVYHGLEDEDGSPKLCEVEDCEKQSIEECEGGHHLCTEHIIDCPICFA